jgi:NAD(P)-dependent dehydrogenase (short-subunit alcohol dehydrogenase family)
MASQKWSTDNLPNLTGETFIVTGASSGLGEATSRALAGAGAHVVLAVRNVAKGQAVADTIVGSTEVRELDLTDLASVNAFAAGWTGDIDVLINNAGIMAVPLSRTVDGFEDQIGTNFLGHFALTNLLLPHITDRVVSISSLLNMIGHIDLADLNWENRKYKPFGSYGQSKLASLLWSGELQRRLTAAGSHVKAVTAHPGIADTAVSDHLHGIQALAMNLSVKFMGTPANVGALPILYAATADVPGDSYLGPAGRRDNQPTNVKRSKAERDQEAAAGLWNLAESLTHTSLNTTRVN